jgi:hypothetical protein
MTMRRRKKTTFHSETLNDAPRCDSGKTCRSFETKKKKTNIMTEKITKLVNEHFTLPKDFTEAVQTTTMRGKLLKFSAPITAVATPQEADNAAQAAQGIQTYVKEVQEFGLGMRRPLKAAQDKIKELEDRHIAPLLAEKRRLEKLQVDFALAEEKRVREEEEARAEEIRKAEEKRAEAERIAEKTGSKTAEARLEKAEEQWREAVVATPEAAHKAKGTSLRKVLKYELLNKEQLFKARPDLFTVELKPSAVNAVCFPKDERADAAHPDTTSYPGLKVWYEYTGSTCRFN